MKRNADAKTSMCLAAVFLGMLPQAALAWAQLHLKVDLALPTSATDATPLPGTLKPGWSPFVASRWRDMYMHDGVWEDGSSLGASAPTGPGLGGCGVHVALDCGGSGEGGFADQLK